MKHLGRSSRVCCLLVLLLPLLGSSPRDSLDEAHKRWTLSFEWPLKAVMGSNQLLVFEGHVFSGGDTVVVAFDSTYRCLTVNGILPSDESALRRLRRQPGVTEKPRVSPEENARYGATHLIRSVERGQGFVYVWNWYSGSSRSASQSEVDSTMSIVTLIRRRPLTPEEESTAFSLGIDKFTAGQIVEVSRRGR